jgi:hypothetical protein
MMLVHYVVCKDTNTTVLAQVLEVHRHTDRNHTLVVQEVDSKIIHTEVSSEFAFPAYTIKDIN